MSTCSNQIFVVAKEGSIYSNHINSVAIDGPTIAMLLCVAIGSIATTIVVASAPIATLCVCGNMYI